VRSVAEEVARTPLRRERADEFVQVDPQAPQQIDKCLRAPGPRIAASDVL
jgi:hypothetical protein